jgi:hypothetical protein
MRDFTESMNFIDPEKLKEKINIENLIIAME